MATDWYARRDELEPGQVFRLHSGDLVRLDRRVPGDGTDWYAETGSGDGRWFADDYRLHPGDLAERLQQFE